MWGNKRRQRAIRMIITFGGPHMGWLLRGAFATIGVVLFRLAMPWPLRGVMEVVFLHNVKEGRHLENFLPGWGEPLLWLSAFYILFAIGLGVSEMFQRVNIMRFSAQTVHDMRAAAVRGAGSSTGKKRAASGDIVARIVGDSARIKAGLSGIMVHGLQNGLLFLLVSAVMLYISLQLGLIFLAAGLLALSIGLAGSTPVARVARKQRNKEGQYATAIQEGLEAGNLDHQLEDINWSSTRKEVRTTKLIARSSLYAHVVLASAVGLALWYGAHGVASGTIQPGELFLFIAYALTVHRRMVQVGRQAARSGKVLACTNRVGAIIAPDNDATTSPQDVQEMAPLEKAIRLEQVKLSSDHGRGAPPRLRRMDLTIEAKSRVAVLGNMGSGKSSLLRLLAGAESPDKGALYWDERKITSDEEGLLMNGSAYLTSTQVFPPTPLWKILGLPEAVELSEEQKRTLRAIGAWKLIESFPAGINKKVGSAAITVNEAHILTLAGILLGNKSSLWLLDNPTQGLGSRKSRLCLEEIFKVAVNKTVLISLSQPLGVELFDRVLHLRGGKIRFDGTPDGWAVWKAGEMKMQQANGTLQKK